MAKSGEPRHALSTSAEPADATLPVPGLSEPAGATPRDPTTPADAGTVGTRVGRGALWSLVNTVVLRLGTVLSGIVLARILAPADYGVFAVALVAVTLLQAFNELGVSLAVVRWQRDVREFAPTVMTIAIVSSGLLYAGTYFLAPAFCAAMGSPDAVGVLRVLCIAVVLDGVAVVPAAVLNREFLQRRRFASDMASFVTGTGLTIALALAGLGPMSFAIGRIAGNLASIACYLSLTPVKVWPGWNPALARELLRFGLPLAGSSLLVLSITNVDQIVVGVLSDDATLGFYLIAFNVSSWPMTVFSEAARRVSLAGFSRLVDDPPALQAALTRGLGLLMAMAVPAAVMLGAYAEPLLVFVYGAKWAPAAVALQLLAALGLLRVLVFVCYDLLVTFGGSRRLLVIHGCWLAVLLPALVVGTRLDGLRGAALAHVLVGCLLVVPLFLYFMRGHGLRLGPSLAGCVRPAIGGALVLGSSFVVRPLVDGALTTLLVGALVAAVVYLPVTYPMRALLPGRGGRSRPAAHAR
ncbi:MAG TPA: lipopolysaccharide biosynthesis protein [Pseudonocardiaceae bacterium]